MIESCLGILQHATLMIITAVHIRAGVVVTGRFCGPHEESGLDYTCALCPEVPPALPLGSLLMIRDVCRGSRLQKDKKSEGKPLWEVLAYSESRMLSDSHNDSISVGSWRRSKVRIQIFQAMMR